MSDANPTQAVRPRIRWSRIALPTFPEAVQSLFEGFSQLFPHGQFRPDICIPCTSFISPTGSPFHWSRLSQGVRSETSQISAAFATFPEVFPNMALLHRVITLQCKAIMQTRQWQLVMLGDTYLLEVQDWCRSPSVPYRPLAAYLHPECAVPQLKFGIPAAETSVFLPIAQRMPQDTYQAVGGTDISAHVRATMLRVAPDSVAFFDAQQHTPNGQLAHAPYGLFRGSNAAVLYNVQQNLGWISVPDAEIPIAS